MALHNKLFLVNLELEGPNALSWDFMSVKYWQGVLDDFVFKIADSFAFAGVCKSAYLFPEGLNYFENWELDFIKLVEAEDDIVCRFNLNDNCKYNFLEFDFAIHNFKNEKFNDYYEFDQLYFFSGTRLIAIYTHHESMINFLDLTDNEVALIETLGPDIKAAFVDSADFGNALNERYK